MIIILGTPGAGKTTQTRMLADYLRCKWFSMGELIRSNVTGETRKQMLAGKIISDEVTLDILDKTLTLIDTANEECIFEGNPRSIPQAKWWLKQIRSGRFKVKGVIHLVADPNIAESRMVKRGRLDDHDDNVIEKRFEEYQKSISPTLSYLKEQGVLVHEIDANGTINEVARRIHQVLGV